MEQTIEERSRYVHAWNNTMAQIWRDRITTLGVIDMNRTPSRTYPHLIDTIRVSPVRMDERTEEITFTFSFAEYGLYQDRGTGGEVSRGNGGDIGRKKQRKARPWFSRPWYRSCMNLKDALQVSVVQQFGEIIGSLTA